MIASGTGHNRSPEGEVQRVTAPLDRGRAVSTLDMAVPVAGQHAAEPVEIPDIGRIVEPELLAQIGERLRRRRLSENGLRDVAGQDLGAGEDQDRNGQQKEDAQRNALGD